MSEKKRPVLNPTTSSLQLLSAIRTATQALTSPAPQPAWRLSNPLPAAGAPPPGAADALAAYIRHVADEAADGRADDVGLAVLEEEERGELEWKEEVGALPAAR